MSEEITIIKPKPKWLFINFKEVWKYRELFVTFVARDIKVRYKQTVIGGAWAILQPFATMVIFSVFFGSIAKIGSDGVPYPIFSYAGLILWIYFSNAIAAASNSLVANGGLITKVYFPRILLPMASSFTGTLDYLVSSIVLIGLLFYFHINLTFNLLLLPFLVLLTWVLASGIGFWLSAINVKYRDVQFAIPFFIQLMLFFTPVIYPTSVAPNYKFLLSLNPMSGIIEAHRAIILQNRPVNFESLALSAVMILVIYIFGAVYFRSVEKYFSDII